MKTMKKYWKRFWFKHHPSTVNRFGGGSNEYYELRSMRIFYVIILILMILRLL